MKIKVPYHRSWIGEEEITAVVDTLRSGWLTTGPRVRQFEEKFSILKENRPCVAVNSCTSGLLVALKSLGLEPGDEVITTPMTFVSTINSIVHAGGKVVFSDIRPNDMNLDPNQLESKITPRTRAILPVHIGGHPCDMDPILELAAQNNLDIIEDCAHGIEGEYKGKPLGTMGMAGSFSFYPTKNITTGEGGMVTCRNEDIARKVRLLSNHGLDKGTYERTQVDGVPLYDVLLPGYKCNMTDLQAALGLAQLERIEGMYQRRVELRKIYESRFLGQAGVSIIGRDPQGKSALHLFMLLLDPDRLSISREDVLKLARERGIELSVNYIPVHLFSYYRNSFCNVPGAFPEAEHCGANVISLPFYPAMTDNDLHLVADTILAILEENKR